MILYYDKYLVLKEIINDKKIYQGGFNNTSIYVYVEDCPNVSQFLIRYELFGATEENERNIITNEIAGNDIVVSKIPFDRNRDLKFFNYYDEYSFFVFDLPNGTDGNYNVLAFNGLVNATIRLVNTNNVIQPLGMITFNVERSVISENVGISQSQYDYLLTKFFGEKGKVAQNTDLGTFFANGVYLLSGNDLIDSPISKPKGLLVVYSNENYVCQNIYLNNGEFFSRIGNNVDGLIEWESWYNVQDDLNKKLDKQLGISGTNIVYSATMTSQTTTPLDNTYNYFSSYSIPLRDSYGRLHNSNYVHIGAETELPTSVAITKGYADENYGGKETVHKLQQKVKQLELASEGTILSTYENVSEVSYNRLIGENVLPYGTLDKVGGMTYKSENILDIDDFEITTTNGITFTYSKGHLTIKGTFKTAQTYNQIGFTNLCRTKIYEGKTYALSISNTCERRINIGKSGVASLAVDKGNTYSINTPTKTFVIDTMNIGSNTEEQIGTSVDIECDIWINEVEAKPFNEYFEGLRDTKVNKVISNGANLLNTDYFTKTEETKNGVTRTYNEEDNCFTFNGTATATTYPLILSEKSLLTIQKGTYTFRVFIESGNIKTSDSSIVVSNVTNNKNYYINFTSNTLHYTFTSEEDFVLKIFLAVANETVFSNLKIKCTLVKGSTLPTEYTPYKEPIHYAVPPEVQALNGYGIGINETYNNYIDYERKVFVKACKVVQLGGATKLNNNVDEIVDFTKFVPITVSGNGQYICQNTSLFTDMKDLTIDFDPNNINFKSTWVEDSASGTQSNAGKRIACFTWKGANTIRLTFDNLTTREESNTYVNENPILVIYPLATPIETDISQYLTSDNIIELEALGSLTFENEHQQAVPNEITYQERNV